MGRKTLQTSRRFQSALPHPCPSPRHEPSVERGSEPIGGPYALFVPRKFSRSSRAKASENRPGPRERPRGLKFGGFRCLLRATSRLASRRAPGHVAPHRTPLLSGFMAVKVQNVTIDGMLASELEAKPLAACDLPEELFDHRHLPPEPASFVDLRTCDRSSLAHAANLTPPLREGLCHGEGGGGWGGVVRLAHSFAHHRAGDDFLVNHRRTGPRLLARLLRGFQ